MTVDPTEVVEELDASPTLGNIGVGVGVVLVTMVTSTQAESPTPLAGSRNRTAVPTEGEIEEITF